MDALTAPPTRAEVRELRHMQAYVEERLPVVRGWSRANGSGYIPGMLGDGVIDTPRALYLLGDRASQINRTSSQDLRELREVAFSAARDLGKILEGPHENRFPGHYAAPDELRQWFRATSEVRLGAYDRLAPAMGRIDELIEAAAHTRAPSRVGHALVGAAAVGTAVAGIVALHRR